MPETNEGKWFYEQAGTRIGPLTKTRIEELVHNGTIQHDTLVWPGHGEWISANQSELVELLALGTGEPPPLPGQNVNNTFVWLVVAVPIIGALIEQAAQRDLMLLYIITNVALCSLDGWKLKAAGHRAPVMAWVFLVPVYLWKRASLLRQSRAYFWGWITALVASFVIYPATNPFAQALIEVKCHGTGVGTMQCQFQNKGTAPGEMCVDVVVICDDGKHKSRVCSGRIDPQGSAPKVVRDFLPPFQLVPCAGVEYESMEVTAG